jgi:hypothetical protein
MARAPSRATGLLPWRRMKRVLIESPFGTNPDGSRADMGTMARNVEYARRAMLWCLRKGYAPYGSHLLYPQCLDDATPAERELGIQAGFAWGEAAELVIVFEDYGLTPGMQRGVERSKAAAQPLERVCIGPNESGPA